MNNIKIFLSSMIIMSCIGCGLDKMVSDYDKVVYEQTPTVLEVHGGQLSVDLNGTFPEKPPRDDQPQPQAKPNVTEEDDLPF